MFPTESSQGEYSINPYTFGDYVDPTVGYVRNRFTVFEIEVHNRAFAKVELNPLKAVLLTDRAANSSSPTAFWRVRRLGTLSRTTAPAGALAAMIFTASTCAWALCAATTTTLTARFSRVSRTGVCSSLIRSPTRLRKSPWCCATSSSNSIPTTRHWKPPPCALSSGARCSGNSSSESGMSPSAGLSPTPG